MCSSGTGSGASEPRQGRMLLEVRRLAGSLPTLPRAALPSPKECPRTIACRAGVPTDGWLIGNHSPSAADFAAAFPMEQVDFEALASPPSEQAAGLLLRWACAASDPRPCTPLLRRAWAQRLQLRRSLRCESAMHRLGMLLAPQPLCHPVQAAPRRSHTCIVWCQMCRRCCAGHLGGSLHPTGAAGGPDPPHRPHLQRALQASGAGRPEGCRSMCGMQ